MKKTLKGILCIALAAVLAFGAAACGAGTETGTSASEAAGQTTSSAPEASAAAEATADTVFPFELTTYEDAVVTFTHVPERVIAANVNTGEQLMALGLGDKIIATCSNNARVAEEYREEYESKPSLTDKGQPSFEVVMDLDPDFIYGRSSAFGKKGVASHDTLSENGIMSLSSIEGYKLGADVEDVYQDFYNLGKIFQVEDKANEVVDEMKARITAVEEKVKDVEPVKVFNFDSEMDGGAYTPGNNFTSKLIRHAGGVNVFEDLENTWNTVSWEAVVEADPDVIIINDYGNTTLEEKIEQLKTNPALSGLKAVQEENFIIVELPEVFASARIAGTVEKFAKTFHPELFTEEEEG
ncbi:ABC transporter substrate-binding protein [Christensenella tenuis]|jgi:iron complex transport system substrate-binding protein|uniref:ABC transporter substrate-binding protein n=1 Tax=Christensenella tenuis TaxID=2763033 RepID=A0ABR7EGK2_9FIRM|nr:ABC transporter substrate-binding protein [Christensenella tenuis]MBC5648788.1 ABC transporter substrate-binding protein [Christensenella tenuis]